MIEKEVGIMQPQAKEYLEQQKLKSKEGFPLEPSEEVVLY
jgi:hypothetical protein